jgi:DNA invertase Pin-like site-specific DNA recombinase
VVRPRLREVELTKRDDDDPTRTLIRQILGAVAEFDKRVTVLKLRAARIRRRKRQGYCEGMKPYGWQEGERPALERMRQLRRKPVKADRRSYQTIADTLNAEGLLNREGRPWSASRVYAVMKQAAIIEGRQASATPR